MGTLLILAMIAGGVFALLQSVGSAATKGKAAKKHVESGVARTLRNPFDRTRDVMRESLEIGGRTKNRATAASRLDLAEKMLRELEQAGEATDDDRRCQVEIDHHRQVWADRPMRKPRAKGAAKRRVKAPPQDGSNWLP